MKRKMAKSGNYKLAYTEYGDKKGFPVIFHHGLIGGDYVTERWRKYALNTGIRLIAIARPGYGNSLPYKMHSVSEWGSMVEPLLVELKIEDDFGIIGISAGAPYAYALADHFGKRVKGVWIISGVPFVPDKEIWKNYPDKGKVKAAYRHFMEITETELAAEIKSDLSPTLSQPNIDKEISISLNAIMMHDCMGPVREIRLQPKEWGFSPYMLTCPIHLWHSKDDDEVPFVPVSAMVKQMYNATLHVQEEPSHFPSQKTEEEVFESITKNI